jgi:CIC family chloride channel protein
MCSVGLVVGVAGYFYSDIFGIGYDTINSVLANGIHWRIVLLLLILKFILVPLILGSGGFGGVFAPSLFMGACFGYLFAVGSNYLFDVNLDPTIYTLVGMGAVLGGINSIPISSILIIFEMTKDYSFILPLMLAVIISTMIVQIVIKGSVHVKHLEGEGFNIIQGRKTDILKSVFVSDVYRDDVILISEETPLPVLLSQFMESKHNTFYTIDQEGKLSGAISENEIRPIITEYEQVKKILIAKDISRKKITKVFLNDDLDFALKLFGERNVDQFPVVTNENPNKVIGTVWRQDVISVYNRESLKYNLADGLAHEIKKADRTISSTVAKGYSIVERKAKKDFIGKSLKDLKIRNQYSLEILMIKQEPSPFEDYESQETHIIVPDPDYIIRKNDILVLFGADDKIAQTVNWNL